MDNLTPVLSKVSAVFLGVVIAFSVILLGLQGLNHFTDKTAVPLMNNSMSPTIPGGSLVFAEQTRESQLEIGDIITVQVSDDSVMVGRLADSNSLANGYHSIVFIGDNKALPESFPYQVKDATSKVLFHIPVLGFLIGGVGTPLGATILIALTALAVYFYAFRGHRWVWVKSSVRRIRRARARVLETRYEKDAYYSLEEVKAMFQEQPEGNEPATKNQKEEVHA